MFFTCHDLRNAYVCLKNNCVWKSLISKKISLILSTPSRSWTEQKESLGVRSSECVRFSGIGTLRMRQLAKERKT